MLLYVALGVSPSQAQVTTNITSSGLGTALNGFTNVPCIAGTCNITGGDRRGQNLFHSFGLFNIGAGDTANFTNDSALATSNILGRVSGGQTSNIFGTIQTTNFGAANLFLINPAGWIFGPTAQLNVGGSFHATTADYIKLGNDGIFYADTARQSVLTVSPPSAFGFLSANPASIDVLRGGVDPDTFEVRTLAVPEGQTLSLVGGTLNLGAAEIRDGSGNIVQDAKPAYLLAPGGRVNLVSVASAGEAAFDGTGFNVDGFAKLGDINIKGGPILLDFGDGPTEFLLTSLVDGKEVFIRGGKLESSDAIISPGLFSLFSPSPDGGEVNIAVTGSATITGSGFDSLFNLVPGIYTRAGSFFAPQTFPDAKVPDITINAGSLTLSGFASLKTDRLGPGAPANVVVNADTVTVQNGASIVALNFYEGAGSNITINAREVNLSGDGTPSPTGITGIAAQNLIHPCFLCELPNVDARLTSANAGTIRVNASENVRVSGDALIVTDSLGFGRGGDIIINAGDITVTGVGADTAGIKAQSAFVGDAGDITITASGTINLQNGGQIAGTTVGAGTGSKVTVTAGESITFTGADSRIVNATGPAPVDQLNQLFLLAFGLSFEEIRDSSGLPVGASVFDVLGAFLNDLGFTPLPDLTPGNAGTVTVNAPLLTLNANTRIEMSTGWEGDAGALTANVGSLFVNDGARITSRSGIQRLTGEVVVGSGDAGAVNIAATDNISVSGAGSTISTSTLGDGAAGNISLSANQLNVQNDGSVTSASGGTVNGQLFVGTGNAGQITVSTPTLTMADGGTISVNTSGGGNAGNISLNVANFTQTGGARVESSTSGAGQGGDLTVAAANSVSLSGLGSGLFSTASSTGNAGQITVSTPTLAMSGGTISVATEGAGSAGNISLNVSNLTQTGGAQVLSSTTGDGAGGTVGVTASELVSIAGNGSGLFSTASSTGNAGQITVSAPALAPVPTVTLADGGTISVATSGAGSAGSVFLNANNFTQTGGANVESSTSGAGQGGSVTVTAANSMSISGSGGGLFSTASSTGNAGQVNVSTSTLTMENGGTISVATSGAGNAGNIALNVTNFTETGGARVDSSTTGSGQGGDLTVTAANSATISGAGTGLFSTASGSGAGGDVNLQAGNIQLLNGGTISANSTGTATATAGNVDIVFGDTLRMVNSNITTEALVADGGNISITTTGSFMYLTNSQIATSVQSGSGVGGNITIGSALHPFDFLILNNGGIHANAFGGPGGNINIFTDLLLSSVPLGTAITASSALSTPGTIDIQATIVDVSGDISQLPEAPLQATELLRASCAARVAGGKSSSLVLSGRGGLPLEPGGLLPSPLYASQASTISSGAHLLAGGQVDLSDGQFSALRLNDERPQLSSGWNQFQLAKAALGFGCSQW